MAEEVGEFFTLLDTGNRSGGFGIVRKGIDRRDGSFVAVKFVNARSDELSQKVFDRETRTLRDLAHPNIVPYRGSGVDETGTHYIVLDWIERNLDDLLSESGPWSSWDGFYSQIAHPLMEALAYTHLKQVEHRDIKPKNVLVSDAGVPLLADFGIAKIRGDDEVTTNTVADWHSRPYSPPEVNAEVRYVRDVYSIGVLFIQCMTATKLNTVADVEAAAQGVSIPPEIRRILSSCIATDPADRPRNAGDLLAALVAAQIRRQSVAATVATKPVWLRMSRSSAGSLVGNPDNRRLAEAVALADLSGEVHATYLFEQGQVNRSDIFLVGNTWRLHVKPSEDGGSIVGARKLEFEDLERLRRRAALLPRLYSWTFAQPANLVAARTAVDGLRETLDNFYDKQADDASVGALDRAGDDLFDTWLRILAAREELARGEKQILSYKGYTLNGREATFTLSDPVDNDLINTEWRVRDQHTDRRFGWGEVVDHDGITITILGNRWDRLPDRGLLVPHIGPDEVAIGRQREAVISVRSGSAARPELRELLLHPDQVSVPVLINVDSWSRDLDDSKKEAVRKALGAPDIFLVQGPPGTGKTSFIAELVEQSLLANPDARILIASQTNVAVDNALEKLDEGGFANLVRLASADVSRVDESVRHLLLEAQMKRWAHAVRKKAEAHLKGRAEALGIRDNHLRAALALQQLAATIDEIGTLQSRVSSEADDPDQTELTTALEVSDESLSSIQVRVDALSDLRDELFEQAQLALAGDLTLSIEISATDALGAVDALIGDGTEAQALLARLRLQSQWLQRIAFDERLATTFLDQSSVIAGTCTGFLRHPAVRHLDIDLCIVDEASRATLTEALVPVSRAKRWVFVGDTNQLPPTDEELLRSTELLSEHQLEPEDVKETLFQRLADKVPPHAQVMLDQQYRMIRQIGDMISTCFYRGGLVSHDREPLAGYEASYGRPVLWVDTASLGESRRESAPQGKTTSFANHAEVRVVIDRLKILNNAIEHRIIQVPHAGEPLDVLVIAPYASQVAELRVQVAPLQSRLPHLRITVMSVDAVQGRESDIAILSVTRSNAAGQLGFLGQDYWRRINVALSRARFGLTIVGDVGFIRSTTGALRSVLDYIQAHSDDCEIRMAER